MSPSALHFGRGQRHQTVELARTYGATILIVHGSNAARAQWLLSAFEGAGLNPDTVACHNEPSLPQIEEAVAQFRSHPPDVVIGLGGGSVMDSAKALAALIPSSGPVLAYLEGVGEGRALEHPPIPMIALPTTAGTGSEVTKNAVVAVPDQGVKVSLRDPRMIPDAAIIDPDLMQGAPRTVALAAGLDAVTQVIEPYLTLKANPMTDALAAAAIPEGLGALRKVVESDSAEAWDKLAWVSTCGGLALANAGLGAVHGFAGVIGGQTGAPHGEVCGTLLPAVLRSHLAHAEAGTEIARRVAWVNDRIEEQFEGGIGGLAQWSRDMGLRGLGAMGLSPDQYHNIAEKSGKASSMKGNPFTLSNAELVEILAASA
ncbi:Alcohol dehydrogenase II [Sulfitobacter noctilucicola]|nr:Alcohol dehydrogenase II [Sulfitobacter noctilucicola]